MPETYEIPGFSRYLVRMPFEIVSKWSGQPLNQFMLSHGRGAPRVHIYRDNGKRVMLSVHTIAALAFHGQQPRNCQAYYTGGPITPKSVTWQPLKRVNSRNRALTYKQLERMERMYFEDGITQDEIADKLGISQATVSRRLNQKLRTRKAMSDL